MFRKRMKRFSFLAILSPVALLVACARIATLGPTTTPTVAATTISMTPSLPTRIEITSPHRGLLAFRTWTESSGIYTHTVYLLDLNDYSLMQLGEENNARFLWSPQGSYLATFSAWPRGGWIHTFTIWNINTFTFAKQPFSSGHNDACFWSPDEEYFVTAAGNQYGCWGLLVWQGDGSSLAVDADCHACCTRNVGFRPLRWQGGQLLVDHSQWGGGAPSPLPSSGLYMLNPQNSEWTLIEPRDCGEGSEGCWAPVAIESAEQYTSGPTYSADGAFLATASGATLVIEEVASSQVFTVPLPADITAVGPIAWSP